MGGLVVFFIIVGVIGVIVVAYFLIHDSRESNDVTKYFREGYYVIKTYSPRSTYNEYFLSKTPLEKGDFVIAPNMNPYKQQLNESDQLVFRVDDCFKLEYTKGKETNFPRQHSKWYLYTKVERFNPDDYIFVVAQPPYGGPTFARVHKDDNLSGFFGYGTSDQYKVIKTLNFKNDVSRKTPVIDLRQFPLLECLTPKKKVLHPNCILLFVSFAITNEKLYFLSDEMIEKGENVFALNSNNEIELAKVLSCRQYDKTEEMPVKYVELKNIFGKEVSYEHND